MENPTQIFTAAIAGHVKLLRHQNLENMVFQQSEHSICTSYMFTASMDPASSAKQSDLNRVTLAFLQISFLMYF